MLPDYPVVVCVYLVNAALLGILIIQKLLSSSPPPPKKKKIYVWINRKIDKKLDAPEFHSGGIKVDMVPLNW